MFCSNRIFNLDQDWWADEDDYDNDDGDNHNKLTLQKYKYRLASPTKQTVIFAQ